MLRDNSNQYRSLADEYLVPFGSDRKGNGREGGVSLCAPKPVDDFLVTIHWCGKNATTTEELFSHIKTLIGQALPRHVREIYWYSDGRISIKAPGQKPGPGRPPANDEVKA